MFFGTRAKIYSGLPRCSTARESDTGLSLVDATSVKARKSFLFTGKIPCFENKEHLLDFDKIRNIKDVSMIDFLSNIRTYNLFSFKGFSREDHKSNCQD